MKKFKKILALLVILLNIFNLSITKVDAASGTITITSNKSQVVVGNTVTFTVKVKSPEALVALQYNISYDKTMLTLTSGQTSDAPVFSGNGVKTTSYTFKFKAKKSGTAKMTFSAEGASMENNKLISFATKSKSISIITQAQLEASYSKNNNLSSLGVTGYTLSPTFSKNTTTYTVNLPANTETITITGKKADSKATIDGLGKKTVVDGTNTIKIVVTAENGSTKTYTIKAIVEELNPINVNLNGIEYSVIRKEKLLESPNSEFIKTTTNINEDVVPALFNEKANITLIGLKNIEGNIELYIYNSQDNTYTKYNQHTFSNLTLYILDKEILNKQVQELTINDELVKVYNTENDPYYYFNAINLETGLESIYRYDDDEKTIQKYHEIIEDTTLPEIIEVKEKVDTKTYEYIIIGLLAFIFLTYLIILLNLLFKKKNKKEELVEVKETIKITEEEKDKLKKDSEDEIKRIKDDNNNKSDIIEKTKKKERKSKKKNKE